jgi:hypothetical protein
MINRSIVFTVGGAVIALLVVLELVRRRHLSEEYSLLWLGTAVVMLILGLWRDLLHNLAALVGIYDPSNLLFLLAGFFMLFIQLYFSTVITRLTRESKESAQQIARLRFELEQLHGEQIDDQKNHADQSADVNH